MVIHYQEVREDPANSELSGSDVFFETFKLYWSALLGSFIAILFSVFVFGLCGYHSFLVNKALTTQEHLKGVYARYDTSPFSHGRCWPNWKKVVFWPKVS